MGNEGSQSPVSCASTNDNKPPLKAKPIEAKRIYTHTHTHGRVGAAIRPGRPFRARHKREAETSLSHNHEECDRCVAPGVLDHKINNLPLKGLISVGALP